MIVPLSHVFAAWASFRQAVDDAIADGAAVVCEISGEPLPDEAIVMRQPVLDRYIPELEAEMDQYEEEREAIAV